jgi:RNA binding exosome subunit
MLDLVEEIESYSPQTGQAKAASPYNNDAENYINKSVEDSKEEKMETNEKRAEEEDRSCTRFLKQKYYEEYFNVSEIEVLTRVKSAIIPPFK